MIAFVFSGGGNRGGLQVGAVQVLLERGIVPDILVGTSVGAINASYLAPNPTPEAAMALEEVWKKVRNEDVYPGSRMAILWRLLKKQGSLFPNDNLYRFIRRHSPPGIEYFADITATQLYIVATHLQTSQIHVFGERPTDRVIDAVMASTALPPLHPPWRVDNEYYVDGGAVSDLPLRVAVEKGAREIYALHLVSRTETIPLVHSLSDITDRAIVALLHQQITLDLEIVSRTPGVTLHHIKLYPPRHFNFSIRDFSHVAELIPVGREQTQQYLDALHTQPATRRQKMIAGLRKTAGQLRGSLRSVTKTAQAKAASVSQEVRSAMDDTPDSSASSGRTELA